MARIIVNGQTFETVGRPKIEVLQVPEGFKEGTGILPRDTEISGSFTAKVRPDDYVFLSHLVHGEFNT